MPKYLSGRVKRTPQDKLTDDRYQYLDIGQAEPNIGDPPTASGTPGIPAGQQYQLVSVLSNPGERYWIPIGGGLIPGAISVYEEGSLVGGVSSITQLNFVGNSVTAVASVYVEGISAGNIATITAKPPGPNSSVLFKELDDFATSTDLVFDNSVGILTVGNGINIGIGGTILTAFSGTTSSNSGIASVGIGTATPSQELDVNGDIRIRKTIYDWNNEPGDQGELLTKGLYGLEWTNASAVRSGAGGDIGQVQYHNTAGLVDGADIFYYDATNDRVGIGSDEPKTVLDVIGISSFRGGVTVDHLYITGITTALNRINADGGIKANTAQVIDLTEDRVVYVGPNGELVDSTNLTFDDYTLRPLGANVVGTTTSANLKVTGISTIGNIVFDTNKIRTSTGNLTLDAYSDTVQVNAGIYLNFATESHNKDTGALIVEGGVGIEKNLNVGGAVSFTGPVYAEGETIGIAVTLASGGGITTTGGDLYVDGDLYVKQNTVLFEGIFEQLLVTPGIGTFKGNLELWGNGSSSADAYWSSVGKSLNLNNASKLSFGSLGDFNIYFDDPNKCGTLKMGSNTANAGIIKLVGSSNNLFAEFNNSVDLYYSGTRTFQTSGIGITVTGQLDAEIGNFSGNLIVGGVSNLNGDVNLGDETADNIDFKGKVSSDIIPNIPNQNNLGSGANRWDVVYANTFDGLQTLTVDDLYVAGVSTFKDDVEFHGTGGIDSKGNVGIKSAFWDKSEMRFRYLDDIEASWGDNRELQIYHFDNSFIKNTSTTGNLYVDSTNEFYIRTEGGLENAITAKTNEGVDLYYDGGLRLSTYDKGIKVSSNGVVGAAVSIYAYNSKFAAIKSPDTLLADYTLTLPPNTGQDGDLLKTDGNGVLTWGATGNLNVESARKVGVGSTNQNDTYHFAFVKDNNPHTNRQNEHLYSDAKISYKYNETTSIGNFGINVESPNALLDLYHVKDTDNWRFRINTDVSNGAGFYQKADGNFEMVLYDKTDKNNYILGDAGSLAFITNADANTEGTERFRMGPNGQLGIAGANYGTAGYVLKSQGPNDPVVWALDSSGGTTPGGDDKEFQFNDDGVFNGSSSFVFDKTGSLSYGGVNSVHFLSLTTAADPARSVIWKPGAGQLILTRETEIKLGTANMSGPSSIYYSDTGATSHWKATASGSIELSGDNSATGNHTIKIKPNSDKNSISATANAGVTLYHNSFSKLATTTDGIKIYGGIQDKTDSLGGDAQVLSSTGTELLWVNAGSVGGQPGGIDRQIQYNNNDSFGGASTFIFDDDGTYYHGVNNSIYFVGADINKNVSWQPENNAFVFMNNVAINLGSEGDSNNNWQSRIYHDGNASYWDALQGGKDINIQGGTSNTSTQTFRIRPNSNKNSIVAKANAQVSLHYDGTERLKTFSSGIYITGDLDVQGGLIDVVGSTGTDTQILSSTGSRFKWVNAGSINVEAGGSDSQIQYNNNNTLDGATYFTYIDSGDSAGDVTFIGSTAGTIADNVYWDHSANSFTINNQAYLTIGTTADGSNDWATRIYSDNSGGAIWNATQGGGSISIFGKNATTSHNITLKPNSSKDSIVATANAEVSLWYDGTKRIETTNDGIKITGGIQDKDGELGTPGQVLSSTSTGLDWVNQSSGGAGNPGGSDTEVQYNNNDSFGGMDNFTYNDTSKNITFGGVTKNVVWDYDQDTLKFDDLAILQLGEDTNGFKLFHNPGNGGHNYIKSHINVGSSNLYIESVGDIVLRQGSNENVLVGNQNGSTDLYFDGGTRANLKTTIDGIAIFGNENTTAGGLRLYEKNNSSTNYAEIKSPDGLSASYTLTLPANAGGNNEVLTTDGAGVLSWSSKGGGGGANYTLPLTGATGASGTGSAKWTLDASSGTDTSVTLNPGDNINISAITTSGNDRSFTLAATNTKYDYLLKDHGSSTGAGSGNDVKLRLNEIGSDPAVDKDIRLIAGNNVTFANDETNKTLIISSAGSGGGATTFLGLDDVDPATYSGQAGKFVKVNSTPNGLVFGDQTTYDISCADGDVATEEKIVLTSTNPSATDHITLAVAGTGLAISRNGDKITFTGSGGGSGGDTTYTLPLSGSNGSNFGEGNATWTLTDNASTPNTNPIKIIAGSNIKIDSVDTTGSTPSFKINAAGAADDSYTLPVTASGDDIKLTLTPASGNDPLDSQIVTIEKGSNITLTKGTGNKFKIDVDTSGITGTTYELKATKTSTGTDPDGTADTNPYLFLDASTGTDSSVRLVGAGNVSVTRNSSGNTITINGTGGSGTGTTYTYNVPVNTTKLTLQNNNINTDTQPIELVGDSTSGISVTRNSATKLTISASSGIGAAYKLVGEVSVGQNFNAGSGTFKLARNNVVDTDNTIKVSAGKNIKITGSDTDFKIEADDIASGAFKFKNTATDGSATAAKFQLYADGETGNSDQLITITPGGGISFVNSAQGLTIASDSTSGGATYSLAAHGSTNGSSGLTLSGSNRDTDDVIGITGDEGIEVTNTGSGLKISGGTSTGSDHFTLPLSSITDGVAITLKPKSTAADTSTQVVNIKKGDGVSISRSGQTFTISVDTDTASTNGNLPVGSIIAFYQATPPGSKWAVCNGSNGTPNLTGRFIMGMDTANYYNFGTSGGTTHALIKHKHSVNSGEVDLLTVFNSGNHVNHYYNNWSFGPDGQARSKGGDATDRSAPRFLTTEYQTSYGPENSQGQKTPGAHQHSFNFSVLSEQTGSTLNSLPPYWVLVYIMRIAA